MKSAFPTNRATPTNLFKTLLIAALAGLLVVSLYGCAIKPEITVGPRIEREITYVNATAADQRTIERAYLTEDLKGIEVDVTTVTNGESKVVRADKDFVREDEQFADETTAKAEWTWMVVRPDIAAAKGLIAPRITKNRIVKVLDATGRGVRLDVGGWYIVKKGTQLGV